MMALRTSGVRHGFVQVHRSPRGWHGRHRGRGSFRGTGLGVLSGKTTLVVPFAAGGTTDLADLLQRTSGATVLIENKAGAGGMLGIQYVAKANPDGYTILYGSDSLIIQPLVNKAVTVGLDDFTPLVRVRTTGNYLAVGGAVPANNVRELVALAKSKGGQNPATCSRARPSPTGSGKRRRGWRKLSRHRTSS